MTTVIVSLAIGALLGLSLAAPPGPMNALIASETVSRGPVAGVRTGAGAMASDAGFFVLALLGAATIVQSAPRAQAVMLGAGGVLMCYFAWGTVRNAGESFGGTASDETPTGFLKAFVLGATNPYQLGWWLTVGVGLLTADRADPLAELPRVGDRFAGAVVVETGVPLIGGFFGGIAVWIVAFPVALAWAGDRIDELAPLVAWASALLLAGFGVLFSIESLRALM